MNILHVTQSDARLKTYEAVLRIIPSVCSGFGWYQIAEANKSKAREKGRCMHIHPMILQT